MTTKEIIELSASVVGSFATATACIIAIWQTRIQTKRKLKLKNMTAYASIPTGGIKRFIGLDILNKGYVKVIIREWSVPIRKGNKLVLMPEGEPLGISFPYELEPGSSVCLYFPPDKFKENLKSLQEQKLLNSKDKLKFQIVDSIDNVYSINIAPVDEWMKNDKK